MLLIITNKVIIVETEVFVYKRDKVVNSCSFFTTKFYKKSLQVLFVYSKVLYVHNGFSNA